MKKSFVEMLVAIAIATVFMAIILGAKVSTIKSIAENKDLLPLMIFILATFWLGFVGVMYLLLKIYLRNGAENKPYESIWSYQLYDIAVMYLNKLNGDEVKKCPFCEVDVSGKKYVAHLRKKCERSPFFGRTVKEVKEILISVKD